MFKKYPTIHGQRLTELLPRQPTYVGKWLEENPDIYDDYKWLSVDYNGICIYMHKPRWDKSSGQWQGNSVQVLSANFLAVTDIKRFYEHIGDEFLDDNEHTYVKLSGRYLTCYKDLLFNFVL